jgi:hypothetical protein
MSALPVGLPVSQFFSKTISLVIDLGVKPPGSGEPAKPEYAPVCNPRTDHNQSVKHSTAKRLLPNMALLLNEVITGVLSRRVF